MKAPAVYQRRKAEAQEVFKAFSDATYQQAGGFAFAAGYLESMIVGILADNVSEKVFKDAMDQIRFATAKFGA